MVDETAFEEMDQQDFEDSSDQLKRALNKDNDTDLFEYDDFDSEFFDAD